MTTSPPANLDVWLDQFTIVVKRLQKAIVDVLFAVPDGPGRATDISQTFGLGMSISSRLHRAAFADEPTEMAILLPGRPSMLRFIMRARELCKPAKLAGELSSAYEQFLGHVSQVASSRDELAAVLCAHDPVLLRETAQRQRAACYLPTATLAGGSAEATSVIMVVHPSPEDAAYVGAIRVQGYHGIRRIGATMEPIPIAQASSASIDTPDAHRPQRLDGRPIDQEGNIIVSELSSIAPSPMQQTRTQQALYAVYAGDDLPQGKSVDLVSATTMRSMGNNIRTGEYGSEGLAHTIIIPTKLLIFDTVVHHDAWPDIDLILKVYRRVDSQFYQSRDPEEFWFYEANNYDDAERIPAQHLLRPPKELPKHAELIRYAVEHGRLELDDYRAYRLVVRYPIVSRTYVSYFARRRDDSAT